MTNPGTDPTTSDVADLEQDDGMERVLRAGLEDFDLSEEDRALLEAVR